MTTSAASATTPSTLTGERSARGRALAIAGYMGGAFLGLVLLVAAYAKALDPAAFATQIETEGLAFGLSPALLAMVGIALEVGLGLTLLLNLRSRAVLLVATGLVLFFLALTGRTYWRAEHGIAPPAEGCGCFGNLVERTPAEAFWQDLLLLVPSLGLAWLGRPRLRSAAGTAPKLRPAIAGGAALASAVFTHFAPGLPLDDLATRLKPGVRLGEICTGEGDGRICLSDAVPEIAGGTHWVVLVDPKSESFAKIASTLNAHALAGTEPRVTALADITPEQQNELFWRYAPAFDLHETPAALLRPLYRTLPRSFLVEEGRVLRTESGVPEELGEADISTS